MSSSLLLSIVFLDDFYFIGTDGKYYILDFGRVFPPEFPERSTQVMYNLLRPNLLHHPKIAELGYILLPGSIVFVLNSLSVLASRFLYLVYDEVDLCFEFSF